MNWILKVKTSKGMKRECRLGRKAASRIMLVLLIIGMLSLAFNIQPVKSEWTGTVYIRADGSIDPPDAPIITYDNITYTLTDDIVSDADGIVVERDNIIVDGNGYTLKGAESGSGFSLVAGNVTIKSTNVQKFYWGILGGPSATECTIINNTITYNKKRW